MPIEPDDTAVEQNRVYGEHEGTVLDTKDAWRIVDCERCNYIHVIPVPTTEELSGIYDGQYYEADKPVYIEEHAEDAEWWRIVYRHRLQRLEEILGDQGRRILDVGCGAGYFLESAMARSWDVLGVEPSNQAVEFARSLGVTVRQGFFDAELATEIGSFDAVYLQHVLEHVPQPRNVLELIRGLLRPGGGVCIVVPNDYNVFQRVVRDELELEPWWVVPPHHLNYFSHESLAELVECAGFEVLHRSSSFPMELFLLMGDNYVGSPKLGRSLHAKRMMFEMLLEAAGHGEATMAFYDAMSTAGLGREVVLFAKCSL